jgi:chromosome segregation ATPase
MIVKEAKSLLIVILGVIAGLAIGLGYDAVRVGNLEKASQAKIKEANQRLAQAQRKYSLEKTLTSTMEDEGLQLKSQLETLQREKGQLISENKELKTKTGLLETKVTTQTNALSVLEAKSGQLAERLSKAESDRDAQEKKQRQTFQTLQDREKELKQRNLKYDQCAENNARLYVIGEELIKKYKSKGVMTAVLEKEPFIQIKKVELEELVQNYKDRIEDQKIRGK